MLLSLLLQLLVIVGITSVRIQQSQNDPAILQQYLKNLSNNQVNDTDTVTGCISPGEEKVYKVFDIMFNVLSIGNESMNVSIETSSQLVKNSCFGDATNFALFAHQPVTRATTKIKGKMMCIVDNIMYDSSISIHSLQNCTIRYNIIQCQYSITNRMQSLVQVINCYIAMFENDKTNTPNDHEMLLSSYEKELINTDQHYEEDKRCQAFNISMHIGSFVCLIKASDEPSVNVSIENPIGETSLFQSIYSNESVIYENLCPVKGEWKICVTKGYFNISLATNTKHDFEINFIQETSDGIASISEPFACDVQTFILNPKYRSLKALEQRIELNTIHDTNRSVLYTTVVKEYNGVLYGSMKLPSHTSFHYQVNGFDSEGYSFTSAMTNPSHLKLQYSDVQFILLGSQTILVNPGGKSLIRVNITNIKKGPMLLPLSINVTTSEELYMHTEFPNGNKLVIEPQKDYEFQLYIAASENLTIGIQSSLFFVFNITSDCIETQLSFTFPIIVQKSVDLIVTNITQTSLTLHWDEPDITVPVLSYVLSFDFTNGTKNVLSITNLAILSYTINGLSPYQLVYIGIIANTGNAYELAGIVPRPIRTMESVPGIVPSIDINITSQSSVSITWNRMKNEQEIITSYSLVLFSNGKHNLTISVNASVCNTYNFTNLLPFVEYRVTIEAINSAGSGPNRSITFYTKEGVPGVPIDVLAVPTSSTTLFVTWNDPPIKERNGIIIGYDMIIYKEGNISMIAVIPSKTMETTIHGLKEYSGVTISLAAISSVGIGSKVTINILLTTGVPSSPQYFNGTFIDATSVVLFWGPPKHPNGIIFGYYINITQINTSIHMTKQILENQINDRDLYECLLTNAMPGEYEAYVIAENDRGLGKKSSTIHFVINNYSKSQSATSDFEIVHAVMVILGVLLSVSIVVLVVLVMLSTLKKLRIVNKRSAQV